MQIETHIIRFERHLENAKKIILEEDINNYFVFNTLMMECFQAVNNLIKIGNEVLGIKRLGIPTTYKDIFEKLKENGIITKKEFENISRLIFLRNLIAHEYYGISKEELLEMVSLLEEIKEFINRVKKMI